MFVNQEFRERRSVLLELVMLKSLKDILVGYTVLVLFLLQTYFGATSPFKINKALSPEMILVKFH